MSTKTRFEKEAKDNSEMAYSSSFHGQAKFRTQSKWRAPAHIPTYRTKMRNENI